MAMLLTSTNLQLYPNSIVNYQDMEYGLAKSTSGTHLVVLAPDTPTPLMAFEGEISEFDGRTLLVGPQSKHNASALRAQLQWLQPKVLGLNTSFGMGDRLGIATPGHVRAMRKIQGRIAPIFAQQSMREMTRTGRDPQQVMDDATWGVFEEGWQGGLGADADHLKSTDDIDACLGAGFTLFTIDPGSYVNNDSQTDKLNTLNEKAKRFPAYLQLKQTGLLGKTYTIENYQILLDEPKLLKAIVKYGNAIAFVVSMYEHLKLVAKNHPFEVEISMDETELSTSPAEHIYISSELKRLGVEWISFAPRFVGRFEKGVDYIGDAHAFEANLAMHAAIARQLGPYKLSLHSGSDKFSIYPAFEDQTHGLAHVKTAGTSYLEALRTIAATDKELIREIYSFALEHFETDRKSYLISAQIIKAPKPDTITDWPGLLNQFDSREILHVTYGSVLTEKVDGVKLRFYDRFMSNLKTNREIYYSNLENHFRQHLAPFSL
jgi:tagaturonate epimerase